MRALLRRFEPTIDIVATLATLALVPIVYLEYSGGSVAGNRWIGPVNWIVWLLLFLDVAAKFSVHGYSWLRRSGAWFHLLILVLTIPIWGDALALLRGARVVRLGGLARTARLTRVLRMMRLARFSAASWRVVLGLRRLLKPDALPFVTLLFLLVVTVGGAALYVVELEPLGKHGMGDALWWAAVTVTTVGYGDVTPTTSMGRVVAVIVMIVGITFTSLLTAQIAAYLSRQDNKAADQNIDSRIDRLEAMVASLVAALASEGLPPASAVVTALAGNPGSEASQGDETHPS